MERESRDTVKNDSGKLYGYARVSTEQQNLDRQLKMLQDYGVSENNIFTDKMTGTKYNREGFSKLCCTVQSGDTIVVESLNRVGRTSKELLNILEDWQSNGITLISLKENIDMGTVTGKLLTTVMSALAEFEASNIRERIKEGLSVARQQGRIGGRPRVSSKVLERGIQLYNANMSVREITELCGLSSSTLYRRLKELREEEQDNV